MRKSKTLQETYDSCLAEGYIKDSYVVDKQKIKSLLDNVSTNCDSADILASILDKKSKGFTYAKTTSVWTSFKP